MKKIVEQIWLVIDRVVAVAVSILFVGMVVFIFAQVFFRYVLEAPLSWSEELSRYLFVWVAFLGSFIAARRGQHIGVELVIAKVPRNVEKLVRACANLLTAAFFGIIGYVLIEIWPKLMRQSTTALGGLPMAYPYLGMLLGCGLMTLTYLCYSIELFVPQKEEQ